MQTFKLGGVCVDSGQIMLVDPCYVTKGKVYEQICGVDDGEFDIKNISGVKIGTQVGDGTFPAYAVYNSEGELVRIEIRIRE